MFEKTHKVVLKSFQAFIHILIWVIFSCGLVMAQDSGDVGTIELPNPVVSQVSIPTIQLQTAISSLKKLEGILLVLL